MSNDAAGFTRVTDRSVAPPNGAFDAGLRPDPFPDQTASLLPGLLAATRTGLTPAGDDELQTRTRPLDDHLLITGRTGWSTSQAIGSGRASAWSLVPGPWSLVPGRADLSQRTTSNCPPCG